MEKQEIAIEVLQIKKAMVLKQAKKNEFDMVEAEIRKLNQEEQQIYENNKEIIQKVLSQYLEEVKKYMEEA